MPTRQTEHLHFGRWSCPGARYFLTLCTSPRRDGLQHECLRNHLLQSAAAADKTEDVETFAFTVMPDHLHWLFALGARLSLGRVMARFKTETRHELLADDLKWQRDFFEHRLRPDELMEDYARYIFLNPYRAGLIASHQNWPGWWSPRLDALGFVSQLNSDGTPPVEWISDVVPPKLVIGE
jgi:putative transposase